MVFKLSIMDWGIGFTVFCGVLVTVHGQSMDPVVTITETSPASDDDKVRGFIATDVLLNCYVENLPQELLVRWQRTMYDKDGRESIMDISIDMAVEDNMKWSIEKPTAYSWRLRIKALTLFDEGIYTCFVILTNNNNRADDKRVVYAYDPPRIIRKDSSDDMTVTEGDEVQLLCNASGRPVPTLMWRRQGNAVFVPAGGVRVMGPVLDIGNTPWEAKGRYICEAFNEVGSARRDIYLGVQYSPKVKPDQEEVGQAVGYQRTLVCYIDAHPAPADVQMAWIKDSQRIKDSDRYTVRTMEGAYGRLTYELMIKPTEQEDYGTYMCRAQNTHGSGFSEIVFFHTDEPQDDKQGPVGGASNHMFSLATILMCLMTLLAHLD